MPIYEYQCQACQHQFDAIQKISDPRLTQCPKCQQNSLQKLISASGFQLKGSGWYESDYKNKPKATSVEASVTSTSADVKQEASTESKSSESQS